MVVTEWEDAGDGFWSLTVYMPATVGMKVFRPADTSSEHLVVHEVTWVDIFERESGPYALVTPAYQLASGGGPPSHDPTVAADAGIPGQLQPGNPPYVSAPAGTESVRIRVVDKGPYDVVTGLLEHAVGYEPFASAEDAVRGALTSSQTIWGGLTSVKAHFH